MKKLLSTTALLLSLAVAGSAYANGDDMYGKGGPMMGPLFMEEALSQLPQKDADQLRDAMKEAHEKNKEQFEDMHKIHKDLDAMLAAPTFDKDGYVEKARELEKLHEEMQVTMTEAFASAVARLPQDERKTLADAMEKEHRDHWHHRHDGMGRPGGDGKLPADQ